MLNQLLQDIREINRRYWRECTGLHVLILVYTGLWQLKPDEKNRYLKAVKFLPYSAVFGIALTLLVVAYDLTFKLHSYVLFAESFTFLITTNKAFFRIIIATFFQKEIFGIMNRVESFASTVTNERERLILKTRLRNIWMYVAGNIAMWLAYSLFFTLIPLLESERRYPMHFNFPVYSPLFECAYVVVIVGGFGCSLLISAFDATMVSSFMCFCAYFQILQLKLEYGCDHQCRHRDLDEALDVENDWNPRDADADAADNENEARHGDVVECFADNRNLARARSARFANIPTQYGANFTVLDIECDGSDEARQNSSNDTRLECLDRSRRQVEDNKKRSHLFYCLLLHRHLISLIDDIQNRADIVLFVEFVVGACMTCLSMFMTHQAALGSVDMFIWGGCLMLVILELFSICWFSSEIKEESENICDALYFSDWTGNSPSYKRSMLIMMSRAVSPIVISTGGFLNIDMEMFSAVYNSGYSYFSVVDQLHNS